MPIKGEILDRSASEERRSSIGGTAEGGKSGEEGLREGERRMVVWDLEMPDGWVEGEELGQELSIGLCGALGVVRADGAGLQVGEVAAAQDSLHSVHGLPRQGAYTICGAELEFEAFEAWKEAKRLAKTLAEGVEVLRKGWWGAIGLPTNVDGSHDVNMTPALDHRLTPQIGSAWSRRFWRNRIMDMNRGIEYALSDYIEPSRKGGDLGQRSWRETAEDRGQNLCRQVQVGLNLVGDVRHEGGELGGETRGDR